MSRFVLLVGACVLACSGERVVGRYEPPLDRGGSGEAGADGADAQSPLDLRLPSSGCGQPRPDRQGSDYTSWLVEQTGATLTGTNAALANQRELRVRVPPDYDPDEPYRIVYLLRRGCDGGPMSSSSIYDLSNEALGGSAQTVYVDVAPAELGNTPHCYDTASGMDSLEYEAFDSMHGFVESHFCVDNNRIFVAGYSQGGALSNMYGCYFAGTPEPARRFSPRWAVRGHAVVGGWREANQPMPCNGPDAALWIQETGDIESGKFDGSNPSALMVALRANRCTGDYEDGPKEPWAPAAGIAGFSPGECQRYTGCSAQTLHDHPLVFCQVNASGGTDRADLAIPALTAFFDSMAPRP